MYTPNSIWTWSFLVIVFVQAGVVLAFEGYVFSQFQFALQGDTGSVAQARTIPTYLTLFIFGLVYQLVLVYDALRLKNTIQVIGLCIFNIPILIYAAVQMDQIHDAVMALESMNFIDPNTHLWTNAKPFLIAEPCVIAFITVLLAFVAWKLYDEFAWTIYKHISADLRMRKRYLTYQIYISLLKFDFFFFLGFTVQFVVIVADTAGLRVETGLTIAAIPVTILILVMAAFFTRRESVYGMIVIMVLYVAALAYFIFKLARMYQPSHEAPYIPTRKSLTIFAVITIILIILTIANAIVCTMNFNKGLKPHITSRKPDAVDEKFVMADLRTVGHRSLPSRMEID